MIEIPLTQGKVALVDDDMFDRVSYFKWHAFEQGNTFYTYAAFKLLNGKRGNIGMHQLIMGMPNSHIDHKDGDGLNNQKSNLRLATFRENGRNRKKSANKSSIYKGVSWYRNRKRWLSRIMMEDGRRIRLGAFKSELVAAIAYDLAAIKHYGEFARLNILDKIS